MKLPITKVSFQLTTPETQHYDAYDNTKLVAYNTCPTWGVLTYDMHKAMPGDGRILPLECGHLMHEAFAWIRLCNLIEQKANPALFDLHGLRLFGTERWNQITDEAAEDDSTDDIIMFAKRGAIAVIESSGYYDDPRDSRRTLSNMEESVLLYIDRYNWRNEIWIRDINDPTSDVGIEVPFDIVVSVSIADQPGKPTQSWRYTGKIDGIHYYKTNRQLTIEDNKTAFRLDSSWSTQWVLSTQGTGYCLAASLFSEDTVRNIVFKGLRIPPPRTYDYGGYLEEHVIREEHHFTVWVQWFVQTILNYEKDRGNPYDALRHPHSCNRYFRTCSLLPFCDSDRKEQELIVSEMIEHEWSPLNHD